MRSSEALRGPWLLATVPIFLMASGCGAPKLSLEPEPKKKDLPAQMVNIGPSTLDQFDMQGSKLWTVHWSGGTASIAADSNVSGDMREVSGSIDQKGRVVSVFSAPAGSADKATEILQLSNGVSVTSTETKAKLTCERIVYEAKRKLIRAVGHVRIEGPMGIVQGLDEIWTSPDLKTVSTPDLWGNS